ncbi:MAG TPA: MBL fold metallo-hydrolase [Candidatus Dormibacteraeota bacterium]|nr:MBL fold metallo-hydrolase [Candidatus Dormibacteraeota bacterium]
MEITWLGASALLLKGRETKVLLDPAYHKGDALASGAAEIVVSAAATENLLRPDKGPQLVAREGEYELRGVAVRGVATAAGTLFVTEVDEVAVCDLGDFPGPLDVEALDAIGTIDVLAVSLQEGSPARAVEVAALVSQLQPSVLVPVGYRASGDESPGELGEFAKEMGLTQITAQAKLTLAGSPGASDDTRVVVLEARR